MLETSVRLLRLMALLQSRRDWSGADLAERLGVTTRTVRNDVERLRILGYRIDSSTGTTGGYRLGAGRALPPLVLDDDEAVAVAVGLRAAAAGSVTGIEDPSLRALTKLEQTLPPRLRGRLDAFRAATVSASRGGPTVDAEILTTIAGTVRDQLRLRFDYIGRGVPAPCAASSRTALSTRAGAGTCWPGTWTATTGGPSARTASNRCRRPAPGSPRASRRAVTRPHTCCVAWASGRGGTRPASASTRPSPPWPS
ncbi:hypothetical protein Phou_012450 [Phytohabitans houttuyneae]|uniref:HTH deoR-type domain-containing protein n=1 Tax=Phytohabitans houttuyneae TaxID=1076126 RepID=A0A6V8K8C8_9ACTN|nr:hypothetical protein Phou_012450 [Phytohabitans houttuyneae]